MSHRRRIRIILGGTGLAAIPSDIAAIELVDTVVDDDEPVVTLQESELTPEQIAWLQSMSEVFKE